MTGHHFRENSQACSLQRGDVWTETWDGARRQARDGTFQEGLPLHAGVWLWCLGVTEFNMNVGSKVLMLPGGGGECWLCPLVPSMWLPYRRLDVQYSRGGLRVGVTLWFLWVKPVFARSANYRDFPGDPVARTPSSQCRGPGFNPWSGN